MNEILKSGHSNESHWAVLSCGAVSYAQGGSATCNLNVDEYFDLVLIIMVNVFVWVWKYDHSMKATNLKASCNKMLDVFRYHTKWSDWETLSLTSFFSFLSSWPLSLLAIQGIIKLMVMGLKLMEMSFNFPFSFSILHNCDTCLIHLQLSTNGT